MGFKWALGGLYFSLVGPPDVCMCMYVYLLTPLVLERA